EFRDERTFPDAEVGPCERAPLRRLAARCWAVAIDFSSLSQMSIKAVYEAEATGSTEPSFLTFMIERPRSPVLENLRIFWQGPVGGGRASIGVPGARGRGGASGEGAACRRFGLEENRRASPRGIAARHRPTRSIAILVGRCRVRFPSRGPPKNWPARPNCCRM